MTLAFTAQKPEVPELNMRVVSLSPTFAGRDLTASRLKSHIEGTPLALTQTPAYTFAKLGASGSMRNQKSDAALSPDPTHKTVTLCPSSSAY